MALLPLGLWITGAFVLLAPLTTFGFLVLKGLPSFALAHMAEVLIWVYQVTWLPALMTGALVALIFWAITSRTGFFHRPYDFGRCFSLGAVTGALLEGLATGLYRQLSHRPFSSFWIAGAMMAGCLVGAMVGSVILWRLRPT